MRCDTTKPPKMFTAETAMAAMARPRAAGTCVR
eukprot:CAMPEP_0175702802 /NCGR_PEP_ID=MMETSP0097-20121207/36191_1 /TAXON_ID=311494 /ORGANISM="Alexandrium monilatum, Strain CCMP3105" /LENGTH=32 /DNA_ID= /DNA_START= /DNA_END= /DNA_ORIENTATION=